MLVEKDNHNSLLDKQLQNTHKKYVIQVSLVSSSTVVP